ncbi:lipocalin-like domain-containing protein [Flammeovirgaceae bacterium SG7u.111]|nr:lipocalin-like domain-containing protein [Flammeovirgaceae bacterium SG7u.132]WPO35814.1 lipocalin-like domain-containing protein [Flammeovirgaceae bacterium SG7u.111]
METNIEKKIGDRILGAWELVSWVFEDQNGGIVNYFGDNPKGMLMFMDSGYMSVQVSKGERGTFEKPGIDQGTLEERGKAFESYIAYYGRFEEIRPGELSHEVEGSLFPNWVNGKEVRFASLQGSILTLSTNLISTEAGGIIFKISWRKL